MNIEGIDLFVNILVFVKILGKGRRRKKFQSLEVREASSSHLKMENKNFDLIMDLSTIVSKNKFGGPNDTVWICEVCLSIFSLSKKSWQMDEVHLD